MTGLFARILLGVCFDELLWDIRPILFPAGLGQFWKIAKLAYVSLKTTKSVTSFISYFLNEFFKHKNIHPAVHAHGLAIKTGIHTKHEKANPPIFLWCC